MLIGLGNGELQFNVLVGSTGTGEPWAGWCLGTGSPLSGIFLSCNPAGRWSLSWGSHGTRRGRFICRSSAEKMTPHPAGKTPLSDPGPLSQLPPPGLALVIGQEVARVPWLTDCQVKGAATANRKVTPSAGLGPGGCWTRRTRCPVALPGGSAGQRGRLSCALSLSEHFCDCDSRGCTR